VVTRPGTVHRAFTGRHCTTRAISRGAKTAQRPAGHAANVHVGWPVDHEGPETVVFTLAKRENPRQTWCCLTQARVRASAGWTTERSQRGDLHDTSPTSSIAPMPRRVTSKAAAGMTQGAVGRAFGRRHLLSVMNCPDGHFDDAGSAAGQCIIGTPRSVRARFGPSALHRPDSALGTQPRPAQPHSSRSPGSCRRTEPSGAEAGSLESAVIAYCPQLVRS
jgi:hypothetical protein